MDEKYDVVKKVASRPAYAIRKFLGGLDMTHEFFTLHGMERQFTMILVSRKDFLNAIAKLGGLPE